MTDQQQSLRDDIAFVRDLAEAGRDGPMLGGAILASCGAIFGGASLMIWGLRSFTGVGGVGDAAVWSVAAIAFLLVFTPLVRRVPKGGSRQVMAGMAWTAVAWSSSVIWLSLAVMSFRAQDGSFMQALPPVYLALYGAAWFVAALAWRRAWMWATAASACVGALACAWFAASGPVVWLVYGLGLLLVLGAPGLYLMRQARGA